MCISRGIYYWPLILPRSDWENISKRAEDIFICVIVDQRPNER